MLLLSSDAIIFCTSVSILLGLFIYSGGSLFSLGFRVTGGPGVGGGLAATASDLQGQNLVNNHSHLISLRRSFIDY
jgi:hypothetical protein